MPQKPTLIVDVDPVVNDLALVKACASVPGVWGIKVGHPTWLLPASIKLFVDGKIYDTRDRVARDIARCAASSRPPQFVTISGDITPEAIASAVAERGPIAIVVTTVLSDWDDAFCQREYGGDMTSRLEHMTDKTLQAGAQGITCPAWLLPNLVLPSAGETIIVATGVVSKGAPAHNHQNPRPLEFALAHGATHVVVGREVTDSKQPLATLRALAKRSARS